MRNDAFFAFLNRMKYINRWGLMRNTQTENIQEHSLQVAIVAHALAVIRKLYFKEAAIKIDPETVAVMAIYHDCSEIVTGDMPTPIKYFSGGITSAYKDIEGIATKKLLSMLPDEMQGEYAKYMEKSEDEYWLECHKIVKAADKISAYIKCIEEIKSGNKEFRTAKDSILENINTMPLPEVNYFMAHFMPAYQLTLDEIDWK